MISRLRGLEVRSRLVVEGAMMGLHKSPFHGASLEFAQHRGYVPGDDLRHLDWKVYAKSDRFYVRQYEQETNLTCHFVLDMSESMGYRGGAPMSKYDYAATLVASFAFLVTSQQDAAALTLFNDRIATTLPPKTSGGHLRALIHTLENVTTRGLTRVGATLGPVAAHLRRRGLVVLVSDFLDDTDPLNHGLNRLRYDGHDVIVLHIADPWERDFPFAGPSILEGLEQTGRLVCDPLDLREVYREERQAHLDELRALCRRLHYDFEEILTSDPFDVALGRLLIARELASGRLRRTAFK